MKISIKSISAALVLSALFAGPASAMVSRGDLSRDIGSVLGTNSNVTAAIVGDTVTIEGLLWRRR